jgi:peptide/nickel transport system substrate-binding protein
MPLNDARFIALIKVDAYSAKITGFVPDRNLPLSSFQFRLVSFV